MLPRPVKTLYGQEAKYYFYWLEEDDVMRVCISCLSNKRNRALEVYLETGELDPNIKICEDCEANWANSE